MKTLALSLWTVAVVAVLSTTLHSQTAATAAPKTSLEAVQAIKAQNAKFLEKQTATLIQLEQIAKEAEQMKIFAKRS